MSRAAASPRDAASRDFTVPFSGDFKNRSMDSFLAIFLMFSLRHEVRSQDPAGAQCPRHGEQSRESEVIQFTPIRRHKINQWGPRQG